jgi:hypothetical protein
MAKWKSLELLEEMPRPSQVLLLSGIEWEHLPCPTFFMQTPKSISFPSSYPLFNLLLVGVSFSKALTPLRNLDSCFSRISNSNEGVFSFR